MAIFDHVQLTDDARWRIDVTGFDAQLEPTIEAVQALVNGNLGVRAALEEGSPRSRRSTFLAGVFNTPEQAQAPELEAPIPELVVVPDWSNLAIMIDGAPLRIDTAELLSMERSLDMQQGVLLRTWQLRDQQGRITELQSVRFASLHQRNLLFQGLAITPLNYSAEISVELLLDGQVTNEHQTRHLDVVAAGSPSAADHHAFLAVQTRQSSYRIALAAHSRMPGTGSATAQVINSPDRAGQGWTWQAMAGQRYVIEKIVAITSSRESDDPLSAALALLDAAVAAGALTLLVQHRTAWAQRWASSDIAIDGDDEVQREVRFALYHLVGAANPNDERASVGARALTGERYRGHVFWDTEIFVWPFYLYTHPETARALLSYRYHTIAGARAKANELGYQGALYPWEATDTGAETTPPFIVNPAGERIAILTGLEEHHITADVAYAVWHYWQASNDHAFLHECGAEMVLDIATFWASRAVLGADERYHILRVIGPDEYHDTIDDNAYTNALAAWCLRRGIEIAEYLEHSDEHQWQALAAKLAISATDLSHWRTVADRLETGYDPATELFEQFAGYYKLREFDLSDHDTGVATLDVKLGWAELQKLRTIKQADVVMLVYLLWNELKPSARAANFRFYEPRTTHDSSLSPSMHALVAARLGDLELAEAYLRRAARIDLDFTRKGWAGATGGVHIAALGGIWQALVMGFLGMQPERDGVRFAPQLPPHWHSLSAPVIWRGATLRVTATRGHWEIRHEGGESVQVAVGEQPWATLATGGVLSSQPA
jgi:kojibiose phosphorylase